MAIAIYSNLSLIGEDLQIADINLASVIQTANAASENGSNCKYKEAKDMYWSSARVGNSCAVSKLVVTVCEGSGSECCLPERIQITWSVPCDS